MTKLPKLLIAVTALALLAPLFAFSPQAKAQTPALIISEFMASNQSGIADNLGLREDWIEIHNTSNSPVDLAGWTISDGGVPHVFTSEIVDPGQYLIVFASGDSARTVPGEPHLPFKLSAAGESLGLRTPGGSLSLPGWVAPDLYPAQQPDISYGVGSDGSFFFYTSPTPGASNNDGQGGVVAPVEFSLPAGFYAGSQSVTLSSTTPNATVRYTTDGSTPSAINGTAVPSGTTLNIATTTVIRTIAVRDGWLPSQIETRSYLFADDIVDQGSTPPPGFPADSAVNNHDMNYEMDPNVVGPNRAAVVGALTGIASISIVTDTENLFDPTTGIYVNPSMRGRDWEREASIELIDPTGAEPGFDINGGIRIRGGASRNPDNPKHALRLFFRDEYESPLNYPLFGAEGVDQFDKVDLRTSSNYAWSWRHTTEASFIDELWSRDTQAAMGQPYTRSRPYHLYLNGVYWGLFMTQERVSGDFAESYFGGDNSDYDVVKRGAPGRTVEATDGTLDAFQSLYPLVSDGVVTDAEFAQLDAQVDLESLADYYLLHFFSGDDDGSPSWFFANNGERYAASNNWYAVRNRFGVGDAGKWQFFDHDSEHSMCAAGGSGLRANVDNTTPWPLQPGADFMSPGWLHQGLITHPSYRQIFADSVQEHLLTPGGALTVEAGQARLDARAAEVSPAIEAESARWGDGPSDTAATHGRTEWNNGVTRVRNCIEARQSVVEAQLRADGLWPSGPPPVIAPASGAIAFNTPITMSDGGESGEVWFTTDGTDPVAANGDPAPTATLYDAAIPMVDNVAFTARVRRAGTWSPATTAAYTLSGPVGVPGIIVNEYNAVAAGSVLGSGGTDATFGAVAGNGGDWFELVVIQDRLDLRGFRFDVWHQPGAEPTRNASLVLGNDPLLAELRAGTVITVSESIADDISYNPVAGDWNINLQANGLGAGAYFAQQSDFETDNDNTQIGIWDSQGRPEALRTGEGSVVGVGVSGAEVFKLEVPPTAAVGPSSADYNDGTSSTWGLPNTFSAGAATQDLTGLRISFGDVNCDGNATLADAVAMVQYAVSGRTDSGACPAGADQLYADAGDLNLDGLTNLADAVIMVQCQVGAVLSTCPE